MLSNFGAAVKSSLTPDGDYFWLGPPSGLQEALRMALGLKTRPDVKRAEKLAARWRPWRGVAARLLWAYYGVMKGRAGVVLAEKETV